MQVSYLIYLTNFIPLITCLTIFNLLLVIRVYSPYTNFFLGKRYSMRDFLESLTENKRLYIIIPRLIAMITTAVAAIVMATSHQQVLNIDFINFSANYNSIPAFKYFVIVYGVTSVYSLVVMFATAESLLMRLIIGMDAVMTVMMSSSLSAALAIAFVGKNGYLNAGWLPICGQVRNFCRQAEAALIAGFIGLVIYLLILLFSINHIILYPPCKR